MQRLLIYRRRGCSLCDDMLEELEALCHGRPFTIELVDVDTDPQLVRRYGERVPVLVHRGRELCCGRLDPARLQRLL